MAFDDDERSERRAPGTPGRGGRAGNLISVTSEGGSALAEETMRRAAVALASGVRRGVPFLGRRRATTVPGEPSTVRASEFGADLGEPVFVCPLAADPGGSRAMLALDANAIAFLLEGMLGGDGSDTPKLQRKGLSGPQRAFVDRMLGSVVFGLSTALAKSVGLSLTKLPQLGHERSADGVLVQLPIDFCEVVAKPESKRDFSLDDFDAPSMRGASQRGLAAPPDDGPPSLGRVVIAVSKTALNAARAANHGRRPERIDARVAATLREVPLTVVAELGRVRLTLGELSRLRVGDTLRLDVPVNGDVEVRVENEVLFKGQPTTLGSQLAVQVVECRAVEYPPEPPPPPDLGTAPPGPQGASSPLRR